LSWLTGWQYRKSHDINGSTTGAVTYYQIRITVHYGSGTDSGEHVYLNGKCRTDFGDIRFTSDDGVTELSYWIEEKIDSNYAVFWIKVPYIPASPNNATIYIYYGKSDATTTSNGEDTFAFFDDFEGTSIDTSKWGGDIGNTTVSNSILDFYARNSIKWLWALTSYDIPLSAFEFRFKWDTGSNKFSEIHGTGKQGARGGADAPFMDFDTPNYGYTRIVGRVNNGVCAENTYDNGHPSWYPTADTANFHIYSMLRTSSKIRFCVDYDEKSYLDGCLPSGSLYY